MGGLTTILVAIAFAAMLTAIIGQNIEVAGVKLASPSSRALRIGLFAFGFLVGVGALAFQYVSSNPAKPEVVNVVDENVSSTLRPAPDVYAVQNATVAIARGKGNIALSNSSIGGDVEVKVQ